MPGHFEIHAYASQVGGLFVDLASGRSLGEVVLNQSDPVRGDLWNSWAFENTQVVAYHIEEDFLPESDPIVRVAFGFDVIESSIVQYDSRGQEVSRKTSSWVTDESGGENTGGGTGPYESTSTGPGVLLHVGQSVLDVFEYSWSAAASRFSSYPDLFTALVDFRHAGSLFVDLAESAVTR